MRIAENVQCHGACLVMVSEPELIMAVDQKGKTTPIANDIMAVKGIQERYCSRLLKVLFDSGVSNPSVAGRVFLTEYS